MEITATKTKKEMKDVFGKADSLFYSSTVQNITKGDSITLTPEYDLPVLVDSLQVSQGDPDLTHVKIIGLSGDWYMDAEAGDTSIEFTVPTKGTEVLKMAYGEEAVGTATIKIGENSYTGNGLALKTKKVTGTFAILNKEHDQVLVISGAELLASAVYGNDNTVFAVKFTGSITSDGESLNFVWAKDSDKVTA